MARPTARSGDRKLNVSLCLLVIFLFAVLTFETLNLLLEQKLGLDGGASDAAVTIPIGLAMQLITRRATLGCIVCMRSDVGEWPEDSLAAAAGVRRVNLTRVHKDLLSVDYALVASGSLKDLPGLLVHLAWLPGSCLRLALAAARHEWIDVLILAIRNTVF